MRSRAQRRHNPPPGDPTPAASNELDPGVTVDVVTNLDAVDPDCWDALTGDHDPFVEHRFLSLLEQTGCVGGATGWLPCHVIARRGGRLVGAVPLYLKEHSFGEYIFDWGWAEAAAASGLDYYPKLVSAVPFTPATGRRLLLAPELPAAEATTVRGALIGGVEALARQTDASSIHWLFVTEQEQAQLADEHGLIPRLTHQYHWLNRGYRDFDDYLARFRATARKNVRRERRLAASHGLTLQTLRGPELDRSGWRGLYRFYRDTSARKWGQAYLNRDFFEGVRERLADRVVSTLARAVDGEPVAGTLGFVKGTRLYGRYWGTMARDLAGLHFELCYHRPIELCIEQGWTRFEAGAQGSHKIKRGLMPAPTYSAHWLRHPGLARAVNQAVARESRLLRRELEAAPGHGPFKRQ